MIMRRAISRGIPAEPVDLVVIGAGINGCGIARDAALRGLRVALIDKGDIAGATTARSTRLIHGGLRYLEHLELTLVRESLRERERLLKIAPHLVRPLSFFIPIYDRDRRGPWTIRAGMMAYDALSFDKSEQRHHMLDPQAAREREPGISHEGLEGAAVYYDAQAEYPERLALENALDAYDHGAAVVTHRRVTRLMIEDGRVLGVELEGGHEVRGAVTVNVTGPWVDQVLRAGASAENIGSRWPEFERLIGGTKGAHLVVGPFPGAPSEAMYAEAEDGRPYFIVPWNDLYLIGTTDTRYEGDLDHVVASDEEIDYLIEATNEVIPEAHLGRAAVIYTYAGVRPLPEAHDEEGSVTRRHIIHDHAPVLEGLFSIVGGKLTTYRSLSEAAVDAVFKKLQRQSPGCRTSALPLPGGAVADWPAFREEFLGAAALPRACAERLLRIYGARAEDVLAAAGDSRELLEPFDHATGAIGAEVVHAVEAELASDLGDVLLRRTMVALGPTAGIGPDQRAARIGGWDNGEVSRFREQLRDMRPHMMSR